MVKSRAPKPRRSATKRIAKRAPAKSVRVHLYVGISLDGYIAAPDGGVDWLNPYADARSGFMPFIKTIGSIVMGRTTYDAAQERGGYASFGKMPTFVMTHRPVTSKSPLVIPFTGELSSLVEDIPTVSWRHLVDGRRRSDEVVPGRRPDRHLVGRLRSRVPE